MNQTEKMFFLKMFSLAKEAMQKSYAPYSNFNVGACIKTPGGHYYSGTNVENASYGLSCCAETSAIAHMVMAGQKDIEVVLVVGTSSEICTPCGACRQRIAEFAEPDTLIHCCNQQGEVKTYTLRELLPHTFSAKNFIES